MPAKAGGGGGTTKKVIRKKAPSQVRDTKGDADRKRADTFKKTPAYRKAVRDTYSAQPVARKKQLVKTAKGPEGKVIRKTHADRAARKRELEQSAATKDTKSNADRARVEKFVKANQPKDKKVGLPLIGSINLTKLGVQGSISKQALAELHGTGLLANVGGKLAQSAAFTKAIAPAVSPLPGKLGQNAAKDALNIPGQALPSVYLPGKEVAHGRPGKAAKMLAQPYVDLAKDPGKMASEHPLGTALLIRGGTSAVGRGAGKTLRTIPSKTTRRVASTKRAPATVKGTKLAQGRSYSPDLIEKGVQVASEKRKIRKAQKIRQQAKAEPSTDKARDLRRKADKIDPTVMKPGKVEKRVDVIQEGGEVRRRKNAAKVDREVGKAIRKKNAPAVTLHAQSIVPNTVEGLRAYKVQLEQAHASLPDVKKVANERLRRDIDKAIKAHDPESVAGQVKAYKALEAPRRQKLVEKGILAKDQAERAPLIPYAVKEMGARRDKTLGIVDKDGNPLPNGAIRAHMKANGHDTDPAFVSQRPDLNTGSSFFRASTRPVETQGQRRSGKATTEGTLSANKETLRGSLRRQQTLIDADDTWRDFLGETSLRTDRGKVKAFANKKQAQRFLDEHALDDQFTVVRATPWTGAQKDRLASMLDEMDDPEVKPVADALKEALNGEDGQGPFLVVNKVAAERLKEHANSLSLGKFGKGLNVANTQFRKTVLSLSPTWAAGNLVEGTIRSAFEFAGPRSRVTYGKTIRQLRKTDPKAAEAIENQVIGSGGEGGLVLRGQRHTVAEEFTSSSNPAVREVARLAGTAGRSKPGKALSGTWGAYTHAVFTGMAKLESQFKKAQAGAFIRRELMDPTSLRTGQKAIEQAAEGMRGTPEQVALAEFVRKTYGQYEAWSPSMRKAIVLYTPFAAWALNAARFVWWTLPKDHPIATAVLTASYITTQDWRTENGLEVIPFSKPKEGQNPLWLQGTIPLAGGAHLRLNRFTPFSIASDPYGTAANLILPQFESVRQAARGKDWRGVDLKTSTEQGIADALFGGYVPGVALSGRIRDKGAAKALNPFQPVEAKEPASSSTGRRKGRSGRSWSGGQSGHAWGGGGSGHKWSR